MELYELQYSRSLGVNLGARQYIGNSTAINSNHFLNLKIVRQQQMLPFTAVPTQVCTLDRQQSVRMLGQKYRSDTTSSNVRECNPQCHVDNLSKFSRQRDSCTLYVLRTVPGTLGIVEKPTPETGGVIS